MKLQRIPFFFSIVFMLLAVAAAAVAGDFAWVRDFDIRAEADPSGFRAQLAARFKIGDAQINAVISNVEKPADAYIVLRLGEMAAKPTEYVIEKYKAQKGKGWGVLAQSLGIKPGSKEFHDLKRRNDLYDDNGGGRGKGQGKGRQK